MSTQKITVEYPGVEDIDICVTARGDREALEATLYSIIEKYKAARIVVGDVAMEHDRAYYKQLRLELAESGLLNRVIVHHLPWNTSEAEARNFFMANTPSMYKVLVNDQMLFGEDTNIEHMAFVLNTNKAVGLVTGAVDGTVAPGDKATIQVGDLSVEKTKACTPFFMARRELRNYIRWYDVTDTDADFAMRMAQAPYQMVTFPSAVIHKQTNDETEGSNSGDGDGKTTERTIQGTDGSGSGSSVLRVGEDDKGKSATPSGGQGGGGTRSVRGQGNK